MAFPGAGPPAPVAAAVPAVAEGRYVRKLLHADAAKDPSLVAVVDNLALLEGRTDFTFYLLFAYWVFLTLVVGLTFTRSTQEAGTVQARYRVRPILLITLSYILLPLLAAVALFLNFTQASLLQRKLSWVLWASFLTVQLSAYLSIFFGNAYTLAFVLAVIQTIISVCIMVMVGGHWLVIAAWGSTLVVVNFFIHVRPL